MRVKKTFIKPLILIITTCLFAFLITNLTTTEQSTAATPAAGVIKTDSLEREVSLYENMHLDTVGLSREAFDKAMIGYEHLKSEGKIKNPDVLSIIDFSLQSTKNRLFLMDLKNKLVLSTHWFLTGETVEEIWQMPSPMQ